MASTLDAFGYYDYAPASSRYGYPHQDSNLELRFRKPPVYPFTYGGGTGNCSEGDGRWE